MSNKGATMLELVVAIAIVAITAVLVVPNVGRQIQKYRLKAATREMANYILETRTEAIKNGDLRTRSSFE
jgi:prepilin-type N-terminal cleavage/methylation domain-containing protein